MMPNLPLLMFPGTHSCVIERYTGMLGILPRKARQNVETVEESLDSSTVRRGHKIFG